MKKRLVAIALCLVLVLGAVGASAASRGWQKSGNRWWYAFSDGSYCRGWNQISGTWYYFDNSGWMLTGWQKVGGSWYYLTSSGAMATGWQQIGGSWYYLGASGAMVTGWQYLNDYWYYFYDSGVMASDTWSGKDYIAPDGRLLKYYVSFPDSGTITLVKGHTMTLVVDDSSYPVGTAATKNNTNNSVVDVQWDQEDDGWILYLYGKAVGTSTLTVSNSRDSYTLKYAITVVK